MANFASTAAKAYINTLFAKSMGMAIDTVFGKPSFAGKKAVFYGVTDRKAVAKALSKKFGVEIGLDEVVDLDDIRDLTGDSAPQVLHREIIKALDTMGLPLVIGVTPDMPFEFRGALDLAYREVGGIVLFGEQLLITEHEVREVLDSIPAITNRRDLHRELRLLRFTHKEVGDTTLAISASDDGYGPTVYVDVKDGVVTIGESEATMAQLKNTVFPIGIPQGTGQLFSTSYLGVFEGTDVLRVFLAVLSMALPRGASRHDREAALSRVLNFGAAGAKTPSVLESLTDYAEESLQTLVRYDYGVAVIKAARRGVNVYGLSNQPWPRVAMGTLVWLLNRDLVGDGGIWRGGFQHDALYYVPKDEILSGDNPFGMKAVTTAGEIGFDTEIIAEVKNTKHLRATTMDKSVGVAKGTLVLSALLEEAGEAGQVIGSVKWVTGLTYTKLQLVQVQLPFSAAEQAEAVEAYEHTMLLAAEGAEVKPGMALFTVEGHTKTWDARGADHGVIVQRAAKLQRQPNGGFVLEAFVIIEATFTGTVKLRRLGKGMVAMASEVAADWEVMDEVGDEISVDLVAGPGFGKNARQFRQGLSNVRKGKMVFYIQLDAASFEQEKAKPQYEEFLQLGEASRFIYHEADADGVVVKEVRDDNVTIAEFEADIENTTVQENVGRGGLTLVQIGLLSQKPAGAELARQNLWDYANQQIRKLGYVARTGAFGSYGSELHAKGYQHNAAFPIALGAIEMDRGMFANPKARGLELLRELKKLLVKGVEGYQLTAVRTNDRGEVESTSCWFDPGMILALVGENVTGGLAEVALSLAKCVVDKTYAGKINTFGLVWRFRKACQTLASSPAMQKVYGKRIALTCKRIGSRCQAPDTVRINPDGLAAAELLDLFGLKDVAELAGKHVVTMRYPMPSWGLLRIVLDKGVGRHVAVVHEFAARTLDNGDFDGDAGLYLPVPDELVEPLRKELAEVMPDGDPILAALGRPGTDPDFGLAGAQLDISDKATPEALLHKAYRKTLREWLRDDEGGADAGTTQTGQTYRVMESGLLLMTLALTDDPRMLFLGAYLYEHHGLAGCTVDARVAEFLSIFSRGQRKKYPHKLMLDNLFGYLADADGACAALDEIDCEVLKQQITVGSWFNSCMTRGFDPDTLDVFPEGSAFLPLVPVYSALWAMSRKRLNNPAALEALAQVARPETHALAVQTGFASNFLYQLLTLIAQPMSEVYQAYGGLVASEHQSTSSEDDGIEEV